ncbi:unnamed protein product [Prorocentrum cordatum]|uniref:Replication protein A OB domain-containing protein n=1 Tax=Prorocentrum cordatum TaxID=2364126 RepID=A0ABN9T7C7_9DINO|nr:unnamed protein product [Polarella glacialis]
MASVKGFNTSNAATHPLQLRVTHLYKRTPTSGELTAFGAWFVAEDGTYMIGEGLAFGKPQEQHNIINTLEKKYIPGSAWKFSQAKASKRNDQYHSAPHTCTFNLLHKKMKVDGIAPEAAARLPTEIEPGMTAGDVLALGRPQTLDVYGKITKVKKDLSHKDRLLTEVHISDSKGHELQVNYWDDDRQRVPDVEETNVIYVFGGWLTKEDGGGIPLTANSSTVTCKASGALPGARALLALDMTSVVARPLSTGAPAADYAKGPAVFMNVSSMEFLTSFHKILPDTLFEIPSCTMTLVDANPERLCAQGADRVYARVSVSDASGSLEANLPEATSLLVSESEDKAGFLSAVANDAIQFQRARLRLRFAASKASTSDSSTNPKTPTLVIVGGETRRRDHGDPLPRAPSEDGLLPAMLPRLSQSPSGRLQATSDRTEEPVLAAGALVLVRGAQQPQVDNIDNGFAIKNVITDVLGPDTETKWTASTTSVVARLPLFSIARKRVALVHVSHVDKASRELVLSDVWQMHDAQNYPEWEKELTAAWGTMKEPAANLKRKRDDNDAFEDAIRTLLSPERKRIAHHLGDEPHPE